eukprot:1312093-Pyramimonas_sp.AAC.1
MSSRIGQIEMGPGGGGGLEAIESRGFWAFGPPKVWPESARPPNKARPLHPRHAVASGVSSARACV